MADLSVLDTFTMAEEGMPMAIVHPRSRTLVRNDDGSPMYIYLHGRHSDVFRKAVRRLQLNRALQNPRSGVTEAELREQDETETLVLCTRGWSIASLDDVPFPATAENIRKLWTDNRFRGLREVAMQFLLTDENFLAHYADSLSNTPGASSSSPVRSPAARVPAPSETYLETTA